LPTSRTAFQHRARCQEAAYRLRPYRKEEEAAIALLDELGDLLGTILDELSSDELGKLPDQVWTLLDRDLCLL
jgi:hypothetical protein